jgi:predicted CXXCH cytochrome family protein
LRNDHPVGVTFPTNSGPGTDFNKPEGRTGTASFFDVAGPNNTEGRMDKGEIRLYTTGNKLQVECASCHDPHGVPSGGSGSMFFPTFLRMSNDGSRLCLTCHTK